MITGFDINNTMYAIEFADGTIFRAYTRKHHATVALTNLRKDAESALKHFRKWETANHAERVQTAIKFREAKVVEFRLVRSDV